MKTGKDEKKKTAKKGKKATKSKAKGVSTKGKSKK